jgi:hypothetical protein
MGGGRAGGLGQILATPPTHTLGGLASSPLIRMTWDKNPRIGRVKPQCCGFFPGPDACTHPAKATCKVSGPDANPYPP